MIPDESEWHISSVIESISSRAGVDYSQISSGLLASYLKGFYTDNSKTAFSPIEEISKNYFFDPASFDAVLNFIPKGLEVVHEITTDELIDDGGDINKRTRMNSIVVPRVLNFIYYDAAGGINTDKQSSDRSLDSRSKAEVSDQTVIIMDADTAARTVVIKHKVGIEEQRGGLEISMPVSNINLAVADVLLIDGERHRIIEIEIDEDMQKVRTVFDRATAYVSTINGVPAGSISPPPTAIVGDTVLHFIDSHLLSDADDRLGYYVAVAGESDAWTGALVELSIDGGETYIASTEASAFSVMGEVVEGCGTHSADYPDGGNVVLVSLLRDDFELEPATLGEMQSRANLAIIGNELVNFGGAVETSDGLWELSYFLRGRKGSEVTAHEEGERFVMLDRQSLYFIPAELFLLGRTLTFRVTTFGGTESLEQSALFTAVGQTERAPAYLSAIRAGGNLLISWQGVGKLGGGSFVGMGQHFTGYRVSINGVEQITTAQNLTVVDPGGYVEIRVAQVNSITGDGPQASLNL